MHGPDQSGRGGLRFLSRSVHVTVVDSPIRGSPHPFPPEVVVRVDIGVQPLRAKVGRFVLVAQGYGDGELFRRGTASAHHLTLLAEHVLVLLGRKSTGAGK